MKKTFSFFLGTFCLSLLPLTGEVLDVTLYWDVAQCNLRCAQRIESQLTKMPEVSNVDFDGENGKAVISWRPTKTLSSNMFRFFSSSNNLPLLQVDVRLRGLIQKAGKRYYINSLGDQTRIEIFSSVKESTKEINKPSFTNNKYLVPPPPLPAKTIYGLSKRMTERFDDSIKTSKIITLKGTLINPLQIPFQMVIDDQSPLE